MINNSWLVNMILIKDITTQAINNPLHPLIVSLLLVRMNHFPLKVVKNGDITNIIGETLNIVEGFINDMVLKTSQTDAPTVVKDNNKTTMVSKFGKAKPVVVHENNNGTMKLANTGLKFNNTLGAHIVNEKEG